MRRVVVLVPVLFLLAACGGGANTMADPPGATASSSSTAVTTTSSPTPVSRTLSRAEIKAALLTLSDMPPGTTVDADDSKESGHTFCNYKMPHGSGTAVRRDFVRGAGMSAEVFSTSIRQYPSVDQARDSFAAMRAALRTCKSDTVDGERLTYSEMSTEQLGQAATGVKVAWDGGAILQNFVLDGQSIVSVGTGGALNSDVATTLALLKKQVERYEVAAQSAP